MRILAIETSCDETAAAVIGETDGQSVVLSSVVASQIDLHAKTGGVVPEVASRAHMEAIVPVIAQALLDAKLGKKQETITNDQSNNNSTIQQYDNSISFLQNEIDYIAYTAGPGLIGSLLVGYNAAKAIAYARNLPIVLVNHIEGHIYSALGGEVTSDKKQETNNSTIQQFNNLAIRFPLIALTVSGGHTSLTLMMDHGKYENLGQTLDDAAGEAFDKVARLLGLGYPGGPAVSKLAAQFRDNHQETRNNNQKNNSSTVQQSNNPIVFPRPILNDGSFNFSFSGLKTAVLQKVIDLKKEYGEELSEEIKSEICCAFEDAVVDVLVTKTLRAAEKYQPKSIILAGGVAANRRLRAELESQVTGCKLQDGSTPDLLIPEMKYCGDNAAMIGLAAYYHVQRGDTTTWDKVSLDSNLELI